MSDCTVTFLPCAAGWYVAEPSFSEDHTAVESLLLTPIIGWEIVSAAHKDLRSMYEPAEKVVHPITAEYHLSGDYFIVTPDGKYSNSLAGYDMNADEALAFAREYNHAQSVS